MGAMEHAAINIVGTRLIDIDANFMACLAQSVIHVAEVAGFADSEESHEQLIFLGLSAE